MNAQTEKEQFNTVPFIGDDEALATALRSGQPGAREELYNRYAEHVKRVLIRTLGTRGDIQDSMHDAFIEIFNSVESIKDGRKLKSWVSRVAVFTAIARIRKNSRKRWLVFAAPEDVPELSAPAVDNEKRQAVRMVYELLDKMPVKFRMPFTLRFIDGMALQDIADTCDISLATVKRRIARGRVLFDKMVKGYPLLEEMMQEF